MGVSDDIFEFVVPIEPIPQGSTRVFNGRIVHDKGGEITVWREFAQTYILQARSANRVRFFDRGTPVRVDVRFYCERPQRPTYTYPVIDLDKLQRALGDAMSKVLIHDDRQIVEWNVRKDYGVPRVEAKVRADDQERS